MDEFCCSNSGSRIALTIHGPNGTRQIDVRGNVTIQPTTIETEAHAHSHGGMYVTTKAVPAMVELSFSDKCGLRLEDLIGCHIDASLKMIDMNRVYSLTRARIVGRPSIKSEDGEISGMKLATGNISIH